LARLRAHGPATLAAAALALGWPGPRAWAAETRLIAAGLRGWQGTERGRTSPSCKKGRDGSGRFAARSAVGTGRGDAARMLGTGRAPEATAQAPHEAR
jgi:hypothetical protein